MGSNGNGALPASPDSAVGIVGIGIDSESMLKEKDNEIAYLRSTIEQNEQVRGLLIIVLGQVNNRIF